MWLATVCLISNKLIVLSVGFPITVLFFVLPLSLSVGCSVPICVRSSLAHIMLLCCCAFHNSISTEAPAKKLKRAIIVDEAVGPEEQKQTEESRLLDIAKVLTDLPPPARDPAVPPEVVPSGASAAGKDGKKDEKKDGKKADGKKADGKKDEKKKDGKKDDGMCLTDCCCSCDILICFSNMHFLLLRRH